MRSLRPRLIMAAHQHSAIQAQQGADHDSHEAHHQPTGIAVVTGLKAGPAPKSKRIIVLTSS